MAQLFSKGTIRQEVGAVAGLDITRAVAIVQQLHAEWKNGNADDETRYEQNFNQLFFNELLGYNWNTHMHPKAGTPVGGKIADLGLGLFREGKYNFDDVQVVVELKGAKIFLDKKQNRQNPQSPVDQGFGYKTSFTKCKRLIVSNFHQVRLYRDNKQDYQEWTLQDLASGHDNWFALRSLLVLLSANRLLSSGGESHTEKLMSQFRIEQQKITKKFYQEYKGLRLDLINDIRQHNSGINIEIVVEKAQKIIDRLVFVHFCEDKGLLPADKLKENIVRAREADFTPWEILKKYFKGVDSGSEKLGIPGGYNGELFKPDAVLDSLIVGDAICMKFIHFGDYDFDDELSVNILGHIFEQSISDLEELKLSLVEDQDSSSQSSSEGRGKRKKDGIFYTPEYIVDYIIQNSLMKYLSEKEDECLAKYKDEQKAYQAYQQILQNVKVLDPACGSGAFLVKVFDVLYAENQRVGILIGGLFDETETYKNILTNNIYGVDLNPESVEITKLSLWLKSAQKGKKLNNLDKNIKCGNSLIDDPAVAGERAFDWNREFKDIMDAGGFDVIVGNPPYVTYHGRRRIEISNEIIKYLRKYEVILDKTKQGKYNTAMFFFEKGIKLLNEKGYLGYISDVSFFENFYDGTKKLILENSTVNKFVSNISTFDGVSSGQIIITLNKIKENNNMVDRMEGSIDGEVHKIKQSLWYNKDKDYQFYLPQKIGIQSLVQKIGEHKKLGEIFPQKLVRTGESIGVKEKGFVTNIKEIADRVPIYDYLEGGDSISSKYALPIPTRFFRYDVELLNERNKIYMEIAKLKNKNPKVLGIGDVEAFNNPKVLIRQSANIICGTYTEKPFIYNRSFYSISNKNLSGISDFNLKYVLAILNSKLITYFAHQKGIIKNQEGKQPQVRLGDLKNIPIAIAKNQQPFIEKADQMLSLNKEFHEKKSSALALLQAEYGIEKISRKLENFWELDFADFVKALGIKSLSLDKKEELMGWFGKKKEELAGLKATIDQTDREIDGMVYNLYGLSDEEIAIVEGK